jgi:streptomycin 6-kinase
MTIIIPKQLVALWSDEPDGHAWLQQLPDAIRELQERWFLSLGQPFDNSEVSWVAPAERRDGTPAVLKLGMPHMEGEHEIQGLRFWNGDPTVWLLEADEERNAMLLERCEPGMALGELPEPEQDVVIAGLLRRLWRVPPVPHLFRPLRAMTDYWASEAHDDETRWIDAGLVRAGLQIFEELSLPSASDVLLATDLHARNVLRARREPWLAIDPKPFVGDPAYDATQHLLNCQGRLRNDPKGVIERFADLLEVEAERVQLWTFARAAVAGDSLTLARALS